MSTLELCEKYFDTRDIYKLFGVEKDVTEKLLKKAYYKLSLLVHPDRVPDAHKEDATEKFKLLSKLYKILTDKNKRALYDEQGIIADDDDERFDIALNNWLDFWRNLFKPLTTEDISNYEKSYVNSELERIDIRKAYLANKGCINRIIDNVPFLKVTDEPRLQKIVQEMIDGGEIPEYKIFTEEPVQKRKRRHQKYAKESKEAAVLKTEIEAKRAKRAGQSNHDDNGNLEQAIMARQRSRSEGFDSLMNKLLEKYGNDDENDVIDFDALDKPKKGKKKKTHNSTKAHHNHNDESIHHVKKGKVTKRKI